MVKWRLFIAGMSVTHGNGDSILSVSKHKQLDRKWFNSSYALLFSSTDSLLTGDSKARLLLPFHTSICHTTLYNHIQLILEYYSILGSQQCAVTAIVFLLLEANGSHRTMSFTNEGVVGCQLLRLQMCPPLGTGILPVWFSGEAPLRDLLFPSQHCGCQYSCPFTEFCNLKHWK